MIKSIVRDAYLIKNSGKILNRKFSVFFDLLLLKFKVKFAESHDGEYCVHFLKYKICGQNYFTLDYLFREIFLFNEYYFETDREIPLIVDCGSSIGMSIIYFKHMFPNAHIMAFEANPHAFQFLSKNIHQNKLEGIDTYNLVLSDYEGEIPFFISSKNLGTLLGSTLSLRGGKTELKLTSAKLSKYIAGYSRIDLIKIDVEGSESAIINDLINSNCLQLADQYIIEYHHNIKGNASALADFLKKFEDNGYGYSLKAHFKKPEDFQDILIHFYKRT